MSTRAILVAAALAATACMATIPVEDDDDRDGRFEGRGLWTQRADIRLRQRALFDNGALSVALTGVGVNDAEFVLAVNGVPREVRIRTGMFGETYAPYEIRLVSTSVSNAVTVEVTRLR